MKDKPVITYTQRRFFGWECKVVFPDGVELGGSVMATREAALADLKVFAKLQGRELPEEAKG